MAASNCRFHLNQPLPQAAAIPFVPEAATNALVSLTSRCHVHGILMEADSVPIRYGFPQVPRMEFVLSSVLAFPHSHSTHLGGCVAEPETHAVVRFCPKCRDAEVRWVTQHGDPYAEGGWENVRRPVNWNMVFSYEH